MMPLSKTNELNLIMNENAKLTVEHSGGDGWTLLHGGHAQHRACV